MITLILCWYLQLSDHYKLYDKVDRKIEQVGYITVNRDKTLWLKLGDSPVETFEVIFIENRNTIKVYYIRNLIAQGHVDIHSERIRIELIVAVRGKYEKDFLRRQRIF